MYDRFDLYKGRYVSYEYQPKGDRFSRGLSELPRAHKLVSNTNTGTSYYRRARTDEAQTLTVSTFKKMLPKKYDADFYQRTFYLKDDKRDILAFIEVKLEPPGLPIRFDVTRQHKGQRVWFLCPYCERRVGKLYRLASRYKFLRMWGCQQCLGLSYPSQAGHKTQARDMAIINGSVEASYLETLAACNRYRRRIMKLGASAERSFRKLGLR